MSAELDFTTGLPAIAYRGGVPWHGYGQEITEDLPLEKWRVAAGLDWSVSRRPVFCHPFIDQDDEGALSGARDQNGLNFKRIPNRVALLRNDTNGVLSVVSDRFKVVQPEAILEFFRDLIDREGFNMHTAGALRDGKRVWALAETGKEMDAGAGDKLGAYLLLATSYDGTFATTAQFTSIRVVCNNTLSFAIDQTKHAEKGTPGVVKIPHNQDFNSVSVKTELGLDAGWGNFRDNVLALTEHKVTKREAIDYFLTLLGVTEAEAADGKKLSVVKKLIAMYESGPGAKLPTAKDTAWGLVNAVTFYADHAQRSKNAGTRFDSASFGAGAKLKRDAFVNAILLAGGQELVA